MTKSDKQRFAIEYVRNGSNVKLTAASLSVPLKTAKKLVESDVELQLMIEHQVDLLAIRYSTHNERLVEFLWQIAESAKEGFRFREAMEAVDRIREITSPKVETPTGDRAPGSININFGSIPPIPREIEPRVITGEQPSGILAGVSELVETTKRVS